VTTTGSEELYSHQSVLRQHRLHPVASPGMDIQHPPTEQEYGSARLDATPVLKANGQRRVLEVRCYHCLLVGWMSITLGGRDETGAEHHCGRACHKCLPNGMPVADSAGRDHRLVLCFFQDNRQPSYNPLVPCTWPPASVPWQTR
jgi:hypothetical protein